MVIKKSGRGRSKGPLSWLEIDLEAVKHNVRALKSLTSPKTLFMACVKADAYGHGLVEVSRAAVAGGADRLGVARVEEGMALRRAGIEVPVQVLIEPPPDSAPALEKYALIPTISSPAGARAISARLRRPLKVHVEFDVGMRRVALKREDLGRFLILLDSLGNLELEGLFAHLSSSHRGRGAEVEKLTLAQIDEFNRALKGLPLPSGRRVLKHLASSGAFIFFPEAHLDMVRVGTLIYGLRFAPTEAPLRPVMTWRSLVSAVVPAAGGQGVGYDHTFIPSKNTRLAVVPVGYADGYQRLLSNKSWVLIKGRRAKVVGLVGMDIMTVDVGHIPDVGPGEEVVLIGRQGEDEVETVTLAGLLETSGTIITCAVGARVERRFIET